LLNAQLTGVVVRDGEIEGLKFVSGHPADAKVIHQVVSDIKGRKGVGVATKPSKHNWPICLYRPHAIGTQPHNFLSVYALKILDILNHQGFSDFGEPCSEGGSSTAHKCFRDVNRDPVSSQYLYEVSSRLLKPCIDETPWKQVDFIDGVDHVNAFWKLGDQGNGSFLKGGASLLEVLDQLFVTWSWS
jgi:hypothetical protein